MHDGATKKSKNVHHNGRVSHWLKGKKGGKTTRNERSQRKKKKGRGHLKGPEKVQKATKIKRLEPNLKKGNYSSISATNKEDQLDTNTRPRKIRDKQHY